ncbi:MAG: transcriptional repressor NrdR [Deltaproteobacteria bacterium]|nr:transcriptional repressor NrdR [Deltaproteobacteria bacterium]
MRCPFCRSLDNHVVDSRTTEDGGAIRRRRQCHGCQKRYTSYERVEEVLPVVVKRDGRREPFDRRKLQAGLTRACEKRPVGTLAVDRVVEKLERRLVEDGDREVSSVTLGEWVMEHLRELDEVAYVRFASVYRSFADVTEFTAEVERLRREASVPPPPRPPKVADA